MTWSLIINDFKKNKTINLVLVLFKLFATTLAMLSVVVGTQAISTITELYEIAEPPHFLQMHKGDIDENELQNFLDENERVTYYQTVTMLNIFGENITVEGENSQKNLADIRLDIGLVKQNEEKDLLLNVEHEKVRLNSGEIGIPILLQEMYNIQLGDIISLEVNGVTEKFLVTEFVVDSQMNSPLVSSTRILLSDADFEYLSESISEKEYIIEAYFNETDEATDFQTEYENAAMPQNGQAVTYLMIFLLSALTDMITVFILIFMSIILILVSFMCIRFTIIAALEEDIYEIGTMKAIGFSLRDIHSIYLNKYRMLALLAVALGFVISLVFSGVLTERISRTFGEIKPTASTFIWAGLVGGGVYLVLLQFCKNILKKIDQLSVIDALVLKTGFSKNKTKVKPTLAAKQKIPINWLLSMQENTLHFRSWAVILMIVLLTTFMTLVPANLLNSFQDPAFITYMGSSLDDILIEIEDSADTTADYTKVKALLENEGAVSAFFEYRVVRAQTVDAEARLKNLTIDTGENAGAGLQYLTGMAPIAPNEIALSVLNAEDLELEVGASLPLILEDIEKRFIVSGIYQDVTSGGFTAKTTYDFPELTTNRYSFSVNLTDKENVVQMADEWSDTLGERVTVYPLDEFIEQTLGGVATQLQRMVVFILLIGSAIVVLLTVLYLRLQLTRDANANASLRAIGFSKKDLAKQYLIKVGQISLGGIILGVIFANVLGEIIVNGALSLSGLGIKSVKLVVNPFLQYFIFPLFLLALVLTTTYLIVKAANNDNIIEAINS